VCLNKFLGPIGPSEKIPLGHRVSPHLQTQMLDLSTKSWELQNTCMLEARVYQTVNKKDTSNSSRYRFYDSVAKLRRLLPTRRTKRLQGSRYKWATVLKVVRYEIANVRADQLRMIATGQRKIARSSLLCIEKDFSSRVQLLLGLNDL
jgi:hypothetical protein